MFSLPSLLTACCSCPRIASLKSLMTVHIQNKEA
jgi:hypothetical protein